MPPLDSNNSFKPIPCVSKTCGQILYSSVSYCPFCGTDATSVAGSAASKAVVPTTLAAPAAPAVPAAPAAAAAPAVPLPESVATPPVPAPTVAIDSATPPARPRKQAKRAAAAAAAPSAAAAPEPEQVVADDMPPAQRIDSVPRLQPARPVPKSRKWIIWLLALVALAYAFSGRDGGAPADSTAQEPAAETPPAAPTTELAADEGAAAPAVPADLPLSEVLAPFALDTLQPHLNAMLSNARTQQTAPLLAARRGLQQVALPTAGDGAVSRAVNDEGVRLMQQQDIIKAVGSFKQAVHADPRNLEAVANLAYALHAQGSLGEARQAAMASLLLGPEQPVAWGTLAQILADTGETDNAVAAFLLAVRFAPDQAKSRESLGELAQGSASLAVREAAAGALAEMAEPKAGGHSALAPAPAIAAPVAPTALNMPETPAVPGGRMPEASSAPRSNTASLAQGMLEEAESCFANRRYDCAISSAKAALRIDPQFQRARVLLQSAEGEQKKALDAITIN